MEAPRHDSFVWLPLDATRDEQNEARAHRRANLRHVVHEPIKGNQLSCRQLDGRVFHTQPCEDDDCFGVAPELPSNDNPSTSRWRNRLRLTAPMSAS